MPSAQTKIAHVEQRGAAELNYVPIQPGALDRMSPTEPNRFSRRALGEVRSHGIVRVQHRQVIGLLRFEQACLRISVVFEGMMAVQMILRQVETHCNMRSKCLDRFQLETRQLQHIPLIGPRSFDHRHRWRADIPAHLVGHSGLPQNVRRERGCSRLAIRSSDANVLTLEERRGQLQLADHRNPSRADRPEQIKIGRNARRDDHQLSSLERLRDLRFDRDPEHGFMRFFIQRSHLRASFKQQPYGCGSGFPHADHDYFFSCQIHVTRIRSAQL